MGTDVIIKLDELDKHWSLRYACVITPDTQRARFVWSCTKLKFCTENQQKGEIIQSSKMKNRCDIKISLCIYTKLFYAHYAY